MAQQNHISADDEDDDGDDGDDGDDDYDDDDTDNRGQLVTRPVLTNDRIRNDDACPDCTNHTIASSALQCM